MTINYQKKLNELIKNIDSKNLPRLLLHGCCAPCSSYVLEYLSEYFSITLFFYNPNISSFEEFMKRETEVKRLIKSLPVKNKITFVGTQWENEAFEDGAKGYENIPEGGERCFRCYELRLRKAAEYAKNNGFDYFTTTLTISPLKNSQKLNEIGERVGKEIGIKHLPSDFKKKEGYKRSIELSRKYNLYRQNYCGCKYSKGSSITERNSD